MYTEGLPLAACFAGIVSSSNAVRAESLALIHALMHQQFSETFRDPLALKRCEEQPELLQIQDALFLIGYPKALLQSDLAESVEALPDAVSIAHRQPASILENLGDSVQPCVDCIEEFQLPQSGEELDLLWGAHHLLYHLRDVGAEREYEYSETIIDPLEELISQYRAVKYSRCVLANLLALFMMPDSD